MYTFILYVYNNIHNYSITYNRLNLFRKIFYNVLINTTFDYYIYMRSRCAQSLYNLRNIKFETLRTEVSIIN